MELEDASKDNGFNVELSGMAALQWRMTQKLGSTNPRLAQYLADVKVWVRRQTANGLLHRRSHSEDGVVVQVACEGIAKILFFVKGERIVIFWLVELFRDSPPTEAIGPVLH
ncbi:hypothetical protein [Rhodopseudomonas palustris]|uniref:hypothetical protein n=1 Tax=Rhodopseudomonas palustris TaxID=1076 RepID=UPI000E5B4A1C|nr:hypothetical protein [Rhodopseudomonas palustris]QLH72595.1 hypothetical protein HZF03_18075 [Rhodopseudomonas palustris]RIA03903.1 hypothetical protein D1920_00195 [Rhodopseudomonas palustris]